MRLHRHSTSPLAVHIWVAAGGWRVVDIAWAPRRRRGHCVGSAPAHPRLKLEFRPVLFVRSMPVRGSLRMGCEKDRICVRDMPGCTVPPIDPSAPSRSATHALTHPFSHSFIYSFNRLLRILARTHTTRVFTRPQASRWRDPTPRLDARLAQSQFGELRTN
ncbi:hypothetical protein C8R45DRAFT_490691 [Mycena sanguinolenta]|nr:hypothetical protein C8R45DRAFT_490691 [Mycena sanguinolenta]